MMASADSHWWSSIRRAHRGAPDRISFTFTVTAERGGGGAHEGGGAARAISSGCGGGGGAPAARAGAISLISRWWPLIAPDCLPHREQVRSRWCGLWLPLMMAST